jgi:hypothetical protein
VLVLLDKEILEDKAEQVLATTEVAEVEQEQQEQMEHLMAQAVLEEMD